MTLSPSHTEILPPAQKRLLPALVPLKDGYVLYVARPLPCTLGTGPRWILTSLPTKASSQRISSGNSHALQADKCCSHSRTR
jgi:hypothetical protein